MRHLAATNGLLAGLLSVVGLLSACGQKGPLVLPDKVKHKTVPTVPAATPVPTARPLPAVPPVTPGTAQPATTSPSTPTP